MGNGECEQSLLTKAVTRIDQHFHWPRARDFRMNKLGTEYEESHFSLVCLISNPAQLGNALQSGMENNLFRPIINNNKHSTPTSPPRPSIWPLFYWHSTRSLWSVFILLPAIKLTAPSRGSRYPIPYSSPISRVPQTWLIA